MIFQHPGFLYACALVAIPIILHLFHLRRRKKIIFPSLELLQSIQKQQRSTKKLKDILILFIRCLALLALIFAFAQPFIPASKNAQQGRNLIILDNSLSMQASSLMQAGLPMAKKLGTDLVKEIKSDAWSLVSQEGYFGEFKPLSKNEVLEKISALEPSNNSVRLEEQLQHIAGMGLDSLDQIFILGDWQKQAYTLAKKHTLPKLTLIPVSPVSKGNIAIDSVWFNSPIHLSGKTEEIACRIINYSEEAVEDQTLSLNINGKNVGVKPFTCAANEFVDVQFSFQNPTKTIVEGTLSIQEPAVSFDNSYYFAFNTQEKINVASIGGVKFNALFQKLLKADEEYNLTTFAEKQLNVTELSKATVCILELNATISSGVQAALKSFLSAGKVLIIFPSVNADIPFPNLDFLDQGKLKISFTNNISLRSFNQESLLVQGLFQRIPNKPTLPLVKEAYKFAASPYYTSLLKYSDGSAFAIEIQDKGYCFIWGANPVEETNSLARNALFPALVFRMLEYGSGSKLQAIRANEQAQFVFNTNYQNENIRLENSDKNIALIPDIKRVGNTYELSTKRFNLAAGLYRLKGNNEHIASLGINPNNVESDFTFYDINTWIKDAEAFGLKAQVTEANLSSFSADIANLYDGKALWKYFIYFALLCVCIEIVLIKIWK